MLSRLYSCLNCPTDGCIRNSNPNPENFWIKHLTHYLGVLSFLACCYAIRKHHHFYPRGLCIYEMGLCDQMRREKARGQKRREGEHASVWLSGNNFSNLLNFSQMGAILNLKLCSYILLRCCLLIDPFHSQIPAVRSVLCSFQMMTMCGGTSL